MQFNHIYNQECGTLKEIPDDSIDVIVTSPPYNISQAKPQRGKAHNMTGYASFDDRLPQDVYEQQQTEFLNACARVIKPKGSIFYVHKAHAVDGVEITPHAWILASTCSLYQTIVWNRRSTQNHDQRHQYPIHEYVFHLAKPDGKPRLNPKCAHWTSIWTVEWTETRRFSHPAPFPGEIVRRCLKWCHAQEGELVLDPYLGTGTTADVAIGLGMNYIGFEIERKYIRIATNRIKRARKIRRLFVQAKDASPTSAGSRLADDAAA